jgi:cyclic beta-1,2-glucan synthetase
LKHRLLRALRDASRPWRWDGEDPIRAELFSVERLEQHAESLAAAQRVTPRPTRGRPLAKRLRDNGRVLLAAYRAIGEAIREEQAITPAAEWLVDNFHVIEEQIREIRDDLPRGFYRRLPKLAAGPLAGYPRVFGLAWAFVAHTDSHFDHDALFRFVRAYQRVQPLTIGELWAVAITLRVLLVENLRRSAERIVSGRVERQSADATADRLLGGPGTEAEPAALVLRPFESTRLSRPFAVQLIRRLRDQDPVVTPALRWLDERLAAQGTTADETVREEHHLQGAENVTVRNVITSMRLLSDTDWAEFFESVSLVDEALRAESDFGAMDFPTRDRYRHAIEDLARGSGHAEIEVARRALDAARRAGSEAPAREAAATPRREEDPGYHLISRGRPAFERELGFRAPVRSWLVRAATAAGILGYIGSIALLTASLLAIALLGAAAPGTSGAGLVVLALLALIPASDAAVMLVDWVITNRFAPEALPGLELREGVPSSLRTLFVVPTLLTSIPEIDEQIDRLEVHYLAGSGGDLRFALVSDWTDAATENLPGDDELLAAAREGIARLNRRYEPAADGARFLLLHRRRVWNEGEGCWIGWERKRGKLHELNRLLRGASDTTFVDDAGRVPSVPPAVRYVITLDADTRLPREAAKRLVGKMAHPLNRPHLDLRTGRVVEGHAVLQPRVSPSLPMGREGSLFQRIFSGPGGLDPYAFTVSDVYQDLFGQGSYTGKGIYDVDVFEAALAGRIPDSTLLSHDLLEGIFGRAALVSDIEVFEEHPARYDVAAARQHRWARGDWQLLPWIFGRGRDASGSPERRAIPWIGRWKMLDNLRRSLSAPAAFAALAAGWALPFVSAGAWSGFVVATLAAPAFPPLLLGLVPRRLGISKRSHLLGVATDLALALRRVVFLVIFLAHQAWLMTDAILRTLCRLIVRRRLLEWVTAAQASLGARLSYLGFYRRMGGGVVLALAAAIPVARAERAAWEVAGPFLVAWLLSPLVAGWASRARPISRREAVGPADAQALRLVARRTWRFFETFVTGADNMLPPDNFQEDPVAVVAHRTSPTNLGLYLLSAAAARDFGWLGTVDTAGRLEATLATMSRLERFRGHFLNWYDTQDLRALEPKYLSSVDSGNLAGHLIALDQACRERSTSPVLEPNWRDGIADALALVRESQRALALDRHAQTVTWKQLGESLDLVAASLEPVPFTPAAVAGRLAALASHAETAADIVRTLTGERGDDAGADLLWWAEALRSCIRSHERDVELLLPWAQVPSADVALRDLFASMPTLADLGDRCEEAIEALGRGPEPPTSQIEALVRSARGARSLRTRLASIGDQARRLAGAMDFGFLFDHERQLLSIGYRIGEGALDPTCYDLLASEARLASFVAIAKGDVPVRHWFRLGRALTPVDRGSALVSWSGSMFEYLMPSLVMRAPAGSLLDRTNRLVVRRQQKYGAELGVPWGVSESAYNARDLELTYQYSNFGVPGLGLKRGLGGDAVIAPYATALAAMVDPQGAVKNFARLAAAGGRGRFGWYEALDYTPTRIPENEPVAVVRAYMAHHQGMTVVAIADAIDGGVMRARFHAEPMIQATELLLQERTPRGVAVARPRAEELKSVTQVRELIPPAHRSFSSPHDSIPRAHLLSNGRYAVMVTGSGSGYSRWRDLAVTRWQEDVTCDASGAYVFLRDPQSGAVWSAGYQPSGAEPDSYEVEFSEDRVEIARRDGTIATTLEIGVSAEDDAEVRRVSVSNLGLRVREIELTSYAEIVLAPSTADAAHPAFSKLFVQTEFVPEMGALLATRRRRSPDEQEVFASHLAVVEGERVGPVQYETDRARFLGRGRTLRSALSVVDGQPLAGTLGAVLDPIFSLRCRVRIPPGATARVAFWTLVAPSRNEVLDLADKHHDAAAFQRAVTLAWTLAQVELHHLGVGPDEAQLFQRLANHVLFSDPSLRPSSAMLGRNEKGPSALWAHGISGDLPIVLVRIDEAEDLQLLRQLLCAHEYWRMKLLSVDLVILNERPPSYAQELHASVEALVRASESRLHREREGVRGAVFVLRADLVSVEVRRVLQSAARAVLMGRRGSLFEQLKRRVEAPVAPTRRVALRAAAAAPRPGPHLEFWNGLGGFAAGGREYVTILGEEQWTPAPWINVVANPAFGFQASADGSGYTWSENSRENQLTAWSNDPVGDPPGEVLYLRDGDDGTLLGPTALPIRCEAGHYVAHHGQGYSRFEHASHGLSLELLQYVPLGDPIKISRLKIRNLSGRARRLSVTAYVEWVLGRSRGMSAPHVATETDPDTGVLLARNPWRTDFGDRVAFADLAGLQLSWTGDRTEFLGRNGTLDQPAALLRDTPLSGRVGAGLDPCGALQTWLELESGGAAEIVFFLGEAASRAEALALVSRYRREDLDAVLESVAQHWNDVLGAVQVRTPDRSLDLMLNRWLLYQTLACRIWARSAFYQASGAYGFRDQLQDGMALELSRPELTREHLVRAAGRQFVEGDVQHWWLPQSGQGVRTRIVDDRVWLAYSAAHYVRTTGDHGVLDERAPFLEGPALREGEHDAYFQPMSAEESGTVFEHCARALDRSLAVGVHGLPLFGTGDWNDGMNRVGEEGKGESVWLGWFLRAALEEFGPLAEARGETERAAAWRAHAEKLAIALERDAWDGDWYRRGWFDDGTALGSAASGECRIDSIAQSWAVLSHAADPLRARRAMAAVDEQLVRRDRGLVLLFAPPFDRATVDPGYIKGYPPGVRENGGQYTHAAVWTVLAFAELGDGDKAAELFSLLNPIHHTSTRAAVHRYKVEPYVACADVYAVPPHVGRGGWSWYTGAAGWLYRGGLEWILGFRVRDGRLVLDPCIPRAWPGFEIEFRYRSARYEIAVENPRGVSRGVTGFEVDGEALPGDGGVPLADDGATHRVRVVLG